MQTLYQVKRQSEKNKVIKKVKNNPKEFNKCANRYRKYTTKIGPWKVGTKYEDDPKKMTNIVSQ